jgi:hypothetical protein
MMNAAEIRKLWQEHSAAGFPEGYAGKEINGIDLPFLDAEITGCIRMYMSGMELDARRVKILRERLIDLNGILLFLEGEDVPYFNRLRELANLILQEVGR